MANQQEIIRIVESHFEADGWPMDVDQKKLRDRCRITSDAAFPGCDVMEIERHRAILGDTYTLGQRMQAFETYYMRYLIQAPGLTVRELPERRGECQIDIGGFVEVALGRECFDPIIEPVESGYRICERVSNKEMELSSFPEVEAFMLSFADSINDFFAGRLVEGDTITNESQSELLRAYCSALEKRLLDIASDLWEKRDY